MQILSAELVEFLKSRKPGNFYLGETEVRRSETKPKYERSVEKLEKNPRSKINRAADDRRDPNSFYDPVGAKSSFHFSREMKNLGRINN